MFDLMQRRFAGQTSPFADGSPSWMQESWESPGWTEKAAELLFLLDRVPGEGWLRAVHGAVQVLCGMIAAEMAAHLCASRLAQHSIALQKRGWVKASHMDNYLY